MTAQPDTSSAPRRPLLQRLAENWWMFLFRGIAAIVFGFLAFAWPGLTILTLALLWGAYALVDGAFALWAAIAAKQAGSEPRWWLAIVGALGVVAGLAALIFPAAAAGALVLVIAAWAIATGIAQIWGAIRLRKELEKEWLLMLAGGISVAFGVLVFLQPVSGALAIVWIIGTFAILIGCNHIAFAVSLKRLRAEA